MYEQVVRLLPEGKKNASRGRDLSAAPVSSRQAMFLLLRRSEELKPDEQAPLLMLRHLDPEIDHAYGLVQQFAHMLATRTADQLDWWLEQVTPSEIRELQSFVQGIERDKVAVRTGLRVPTNN